MWAGGRERNFLEDDEGEERFDDDDSLNLQLALRDAFSPGLPPRPGVLATLDQSAQAAL